MENTSQQNALLLFSSPWQRLSFFNDLPLPLIHSLLENSAIKHIQNKEVLLKQNEVADSFGFVVEGLVRLQRTNPREQRVVMDFVGPGGLIGGLLMAQSQMLYPVTAQAVGPGLFLKIPKATYLKHWMKDPEVVARVQNCNLERMQAIHSTREMAKYTLEEKMAEILLRLSQRDEKQIELKISKTDLADMVGAAVESVIRVFTHWEKKGWLLRSPHRPDLVFKDKIREISTSPSF